ncbi:HPF/RaiA family ribosome-associated protein [Thiohalocapsa sp. ML1]|jgi:ribosome-associated translation inhibitor RaiA|uniref:HPF/RaiA family ribosome-associated protein n=1 Tax=Thiohalocapsa sp. ML1 TaxID=1431688 RepID=UPI000732369B|nr:HPF/RaiA family ribosome-associated protein [Thiohalocapsa sp. ML1]
MSVRITGDTLALDSKLVRRINQHADNLQSATPDQPLDLQVRIAEEFDQLRGHRVRCELVATLSAKRQIIVREAQKKAEQAIDTAFAGLKTKLRRQRIQSLGREGAAQALRATGT